MLAAVGLSIVQKRFLCMATPVSLVPLLQLRPAGAGGRSHRDHRSGRHAMWLLKSLSAVSVSLAFTSYVFMLIAIAHS